VDHGPASVLGCRLSAVLPLRGGGAPLVLQQLTEQPQEALAMRRRQPHPQLDEVAVIYGRGGERRSAYAPLLCHGLRPNLVDNGDEIQ
jgi:hypothetical protein